MQTTFISMEGDEGFRRFREKVLSGFTDEENESYETETPSSSKEPHLISVIRPQRCKIYNCRSRGKTFKIQAARVKFTRLRSQKWCIL